MSGGLLAGGSCLGGFCPGACDLIPISVMVDPNVTITL